MGPEDQSSVYGLGNCNFFSYNYECDLVLHTDYLPHPPQEPPTERSRRLRSAGRKEQTRPALGK